MKDLSRDLTRSISEGEKSRVGLHDISLPIKIQLRLCDKAGTVQWPAEFNSEGRLV